LALNLCCRSQYCLSNKPETKPFEPAVTGVTKYPITEYQPLYYVADSFEDAKQKACLCSHVGKLRGFNTTLQYSALLPLPP
jgi:phenylalanine-4-hydroxylase